MAKLIPGAVDLRTPLYNKDEDTGTIYHLLTDTTADQVKYASEQNGEAVKAALESGIAGAQGTASSALAAANSASASAKQANQTASSALSTANSAKGAAEAAQSTANSASASAAQAGQTADSALSIANTAKSIADEVKVQVDNTTSGLAATKDIADRAFATANEAKSAAVVMQGATANAAGEKGLVPQPVAGNQNKYLRGDGTWQTPPDNNTTYTVATTSAAGLYPQLGGGTTNYLRADGTWSKPPDTNTTYGNATKDAPGLMSKDDKIKLDGIQAGAQVNPTLPTVKSLFPSANNNPGFLAVFDASYVNAGYLSIATAKTLFATDLSSRVAKSGDTMTGPLTISRDGKALIIKNTRVDINTPTQEAIASWLIYTDKNDKELVKILMGQAYASAGFNYCDTIVTNTGGTKSVKTRLKCLNNGAGVFEVPTSTASASLNGAVNLQTLNATLGTGTSLTALANLDESSEDYVETLDIKKQKAIAQVNAEAQQAIYGGFPYEINGEEYFIDYSLFDQQNLASRALIAARSPDETISLPCRDESGFRAWLDASAETVLAIHKHGLLFHTDAILKMADEKKARIMSAQTEEEIKAIYME